MTTILDIAADYRALEQLIEEAQGELTPELEAWLTEMEQTLATKTDAYVHILTRLEATEDYLNEQAKKLSDAAKSIEAHRERMKSRIKLAMVTMDRREVGSGAWLFKRSPAAPRLVIDDEAKIPQAFKVQRWEVVKSDIKDAIAKGAPVDGAHIETGDSLRIYPNRGGK